MVYPPSSEAASSAYFVVNTGGGESEMVIVAPKSVADLNEFLGTTTANELDFNTSLNRLAYEQLRALTTVG